MQPEFFKYHALGNDYIVIDPNRTQINLNADAIKLICHRNLGIGSDGILYGPIFEDGIIKLRILNPDGSEAAKRKWLSQAIIYQCSPDRIRT